MRIEDIVLLLKNEATYGVDPTPDATNNAMLTTGMQHTPYAGNRVSRALDKITLGANSEVNVNPHSGLQFGIELAGAGAAGRLPGYDPALLASGMAVAQNVLHTGTATAGAATTITLDAGASAVDDTYNGMWLEITGGTGSGQEGKITDYDGTTKVATVDVTFSPVPDATSVFNVYDKATYTFAASGFGSATGYFYQREEVGSNDQIHQSLGFRGDMGYRLARGEIPRFTFQNFLGSYVRPTSVTRITPDWSRFQVPLAVTKDNSPTVTIDGYAACVESVEFSANMQIARVNGPNCEETQIGSPQQPGGTITIKATEISQKDLWPLIENHAGITLVPIVFTHGTTIGNIVVLQHTKAQLLEITRTSIDGKLGYQIPFLATDDSAAEPVEIITQ